MIIMESPRYIRSFDALKHLGGIASEYGTRALIIAGERAFNAVQDKVERSLSAADIEYQVVIYKGFCSMVHIERAMSQIGDFTADLVLGIGGGTVMDASKKIAQDLGLPIITVPTIASTCAAWTPLSVMYDEHGAVVAEDWLSHSPKAVIADTEAIMKAPVRYLIAGIGDSIAKWFEPNFVRQALDVTADCFLRSTLELARASYQIVSDNGEKAIEQCKARTPGPELDAVIDACIAVTGMLSGIAGDVGRFAVAHGFYNAFSAVPVSKTLLHGEIVALGILLQESLRNERFVIADKELLSFCQRMGLPTNWQEAGLRELTDDELELVVSRMDAGDSCKALRELPLEVDLSARRLKEVLAAQHDAQ